MNIEILKINKYYNMETENCAFCLNIHMKIFIKKKINKKFKDLDFLYYINKE